MTQENQNQPSQKQPKKKIIYERTDMPKQPPHIRRRNFREVAHGYTRELAVQEAKRCLQCKKPFCVDGCPVEINIPGFIHCIANEEFTGAIRVLKEKNCLPAVCGRVCPQEEQCEQRCVLGKRESPLPLAAWSDSLLKWKPPKKKWNCRKSTLPPEKK